MTARHPRCLPSPGVFRFLSLIPALLLAGSMALSAQESPTFVDTLDFIRRSLDEHGDFRNLAGGGRVQQKLTEVLGRRFRVRRILSDGTPGGPEIRGTTEFSLAELDPEATHVRITFIGDRMAFAVWLADVGKGAGVREWRAGNEDLGAENRPYGWFAVDSEELAQSLVRAVNHCIALAGGKARPSVDRFFGAPSQSRAVPTSPITGEVHHVVSLEDAEKLVRRKIRSDPAVFPQIAAGTLGKSGWAPVPWPGRPLLVTLPGTGSGFETNYLDAVRFDGTLAGKGNGVALLLEVVPDFISAGVSGLRDGPLPCELVQLPLNAGQLVPLAQRVGEGTQVRLWSSVGDGWPDEEGGFVWLARSREGAREWRVAAHSMKRFREYGPDAARAAATELGLKLADPVVDLLKSRAKAAKKAMKEDR